MAFQPQFQPLSPAEERAGHSGRATFARTQQVAPRTHSSASPPFRSTLGARPSSASRSAAAAASPSSAAMHARPFYLSASGSRNKNFKGTFSAFPYASGGAGEPLSSESSSSAHRWRSVDAHGAPSAVHRGVTSLRSRSNENGQPGLWGVPEPNRTLDGRVDFLWEPQGHPDGTAGGYTGGGMRVTDNFRRRGEGLAGVERTQAAQRSLHPRAFRGGAHDHPSLFDPELKAHSGAFGSLPASERAQLQQQALLRVPHAAPFRGAGVCAPADRSFVGGHAAHGYHYSEYGLSEKSLSDGKILNGTTSGFRAPCAHAIHYPFKATTARSSLPTETDRNHNLHAVQAADETCRHHCNEVIQAAKTRTQQPAFTARF